ncbi:hypothetical protein BO71DRAFT_480959 [Aspergillus ellipticus CBS 707.79]|uniref:Uncharacterized protein n=1 Tax=Aspergillus ellipticus CBS 707.79 TaxID=1448320 RepID=A0A319DJE3_9EURO|nr:hypothetical protein BO71DRAFT_480959 [Aspergillus ellipticus CBS 707.79]
MEDGQLWAERQPEWELRSPKTQSATAAHPPVTKPTRTHFFGGRAAIGPGQIGQSASDAATDMELERTTVRISGYAGLVADGVLLDGIGLIFSRTYNTSWFG